MMTLRMDSSTEASLSNMHTYIEAAQKLEDVMRHFEELVHLWWDSNPSVFEESLTSFTE